MRYVYAALGFLLFLIALGFALKNAEPITLHYYLGIAWQAPLSLILLIVFGAGALAGILAALTAIVTARRRVLAVQRELDLLRTEQNIPG